MNRIVNVARRNQIVPLIACLIISTCIQTHQCCGQSILVLRDMSVIKTRSVRFDQEHVVTAEGKSFGWDQVWTADLGSEELSQFETNVKEIGLPLFQIRHRLMNFDWASLPEIAEPLYSQQITQPTTAANQRRHYLISLATYRGRIATGKRAAALAPFFDICEIHRRFPESGAEFAAANVPNEELDNQFTSQLLPIWFDPLATQEIYENLTAKLNDDIKELSDGALIYLASIKLASQNNSAGSPIDQHQKPDDILQILATRNSNLARRWTLILNAQDEIRDGVAGAATLQLLKTYSRLEGPVRAVANYLVAQQRRDNNDEYDLAVLDLLYIPANHSREFPQLSKAAIKLAAEISEKAGRPLEARILRSQLSK